MDRKRRLTSHQQSVLYPPSASYERKAEAEAIGVSIGIDPRTKSPAMRFIYLDNHGKKFMGSCLPTTLADLLMHREIVALKKQIRELKRQLERAQKLGSRHT